MRKDEIYELIKRAGYMYAKDVYETWKERYDVTNPENIWYHDSYDEKGYPHKEKFQEQIFDESYHNYCDGDTEDFFDWCCIDINKKDIELVADEYLYDYLKEGLDKFIKEKY